ncbi:hypothetical protein [Adhaeretor mobilis]|uniref:Type II toxin-antitoxin system RelE/ParE family toxin n=1 Tax=Adhaeretor mobilis TaxID=1930276 RepID=A0A517MVJ1_9BACT|nr:hypothetical protein [Adhaeretor mobilis]QDS98889.1 hypothetical protein HG15A2_21770 [Adhaeretor mobilis]
MKNFTVVSLDEATDDLASLWMDATDRDAVSAASDHVESQLADDPFTQSANLGGNLWMYEAPPLRYFYKPSIADRMVTILSVVRIE